MSWKDQVDERFNGKKLAAQRAQEADWRRYLESEKPWQRLSCHVCGKKASGPTEHTREGINGPIGTGWTDYSDPKDLEKCTYCHRWTCPDHYNAVDVGNGRFLVGKCRCCWEGRNFLFGLFHNW